MSLRVAHRRRSLRLRGFDYGRPGVYFITIRARNDDGCALGRATTRGVELNAAGKIAKDCWLAIPKHFPGVQLDAFIVMPDHVHGILAIPEGPHRRSVGAQHAAPLHLPMPSPIADQPRVAPGSLGAIVRSFKSATTKRINEMRGTPGAPLWQRNYFDRIIRNRSELARVRWYIRINPARLDMSREG
jgi:putative transposase